MVVVVLIATGAAVAIRLYKAAEAQEAEVFDRLIFSVKQQAGVVGALAAVVFAILAALQSGKQAVTSIASSTVPIFGTHRGGVPQTGAPAAA